MVITGPRKSCMIISSSGARHRAMRAWSKERRPPTGGKCRCKACRALHEGFPASSETGNPSSFPPGPRPSSPARGRGPRGARGPGFRCGSGGRAVDGRGRGRGGPGHGASCRTPFAAHRAACGNDAEAEPAGSGLCGPADPDGRPHRAPNDRRTPGTCLCLHRGSAGPVRLDAEALGEALCEAVRPVSVVVRTCPGRGCVRGLLLRNPSRHLRPGAGRWPVVRRHGPTDTEREFTRFQAPPAAGRGRHAHRPRPDRSVPQPAQVRPGAASGTGAEHGVLRRRCPGRRSRPCRGSPREGRRRRRTSHRGPGSPPTRGGAP